jgi:hypothetical protein
MKKAHSKTFQVHHLVSDLLVTSVASPSSFGVGRRYISENIINVGPRMQGSTILGN